MTHRRIPRARDGQLRFRRPEAAGVCERDTESGYLWIIHSFHNSFRSHHSSRVLPSGACLFSHLFSAVCVRTAVICRSDHGHGRA